MCYHPTQHPTLGQYGLRAMLVAVLATAKLQSQYTPTELIA
jgi:hypothetical protein